MIDRLLDRIHRLFHGHLPVWRCRFDGIGRDWYCHTCHPSRTGGAP